MNGPGVGNDTVLARAPGVLERRTGTSVVVLGDAEPMALRGTGIAVWDTFATPSSVADAVTQLARVYDAPAETVLTEMLPVLEALCDAHALCIVAPDELDGVAP